MGKHDSGASRDRRCALINSRMGEFFAKAKRALPDPRKAGFGHYGGFFQGKLIAGLRIYHRNGLGRFQTVSTHPDYQRQGFCQTLVYQASKEVLASGKVTELVMCADPDYHAIKIYESVGFKRQVVENGVCWWDKSREGE